MPYRTDSSADEARRVDAPRANAMQVQRSDMIDRFVAMGLVGATIAALAVAVWQR